MNPHIAIIACGSRHWTDSVIVGEALSAMRTQTQFLTLIHGGAPGADTLAAHWGSVTLGVRVIAIPALWTVFDRAAGPIRNTEMLCLLEAVRADFKCVLGFKDGFSPGRGGGTEDMIAQSAVAGFKCAVFDSTREIIFRANYGTDTC